MQRRWPILVAYGLVAASTQMLWITFAPITTEAAHAMHTSVAAVGNLAAIFPLIYVVLALPTGRWLDRDFNTALRTGAILTGAGAVIRLFMPDSFTWQLFAQVVISVGQPLVLNGITKLAARYFPQEERAVAIGLGSVSLFIGIMIAMAGGPALYTSGGLSLVLTVEAAIAVAGAILLVLSMQSPPAFEDPPASPSGSWLPKEPLLWKLGALLFVGMGVYNVLATWLQPILAPFGAGNLTGDLLALMTLTGIVGAGVLPPIVAARGWRRWTLFAAVGWTLLTALAIDWRQSAVWLAVWLGLEGILLLASLPVVLDWAEVHVGAGEQGRAVGFLMLAGNLGGFVLVVAVTPLVALPHLALAFIAFVALVGLVVAWQLPSPSAVPAALSASQPQ
ncbi:MAG: MFS transporter [Thermaerobacter sp.]|nr:MFS transporter [Thermaerobacter sp.]